MMKMLKNNKKLQISPEANWRRYLTKAKGDEKGIALVFALFFTVVLLVLGNMFILRIVHESNMVKFERESAKAFYAANAGGQAAIKQMDTFMNTFLLNTIASASPGGVVTTTQNSVDTGDGIGWLLYAVRENNNPVLTQNGEQAEYQDNAAIGDQSYDYFIVITEKFDPIAVGTEAWNLSYNYQIESTGTAGNFTNKIVLSGDFTVVVQKDNFAKYALFTNTQTMPSGTNVWFTDKTNFSGPIHTNDRFNFALNPSGIFDGLASQQQQNARFYNSGSPILLDADFNGTEDVPTFNAGFDRGAAAVTLDASAQQQGMIDQAKGGEVISGSGIYVPNDGTSLTGGIYVEGDSTVDLSVDGSDNAVYTITQGASTKIITVDQTNNQTTIDDISAGTLNTYVGQPKGIDQKGTLLYVNGRITGLGGTVQRDTELTVSSDNDAIISDHLRYTDYTPAAGNPGDPGYTPPNADGATNLLGVVTWNGDVRIGTAAPNDIDIHGTMLSANGIFQVDNYNDQGVGPRGTATLLGGSITDNYGAFGLFSGSTGQQLSGYGRNFVYDGRMLLGSAPPYFPTLSIFTAFSNDLTDTVIWQQGEL